MIGKILQFIGIERSMPSGCDGLDRDIAVIFDNCESRKFDFSGIHLSQEKINILVVDDSFGIISIIKDTIDAVMGEDVNVVSFHGKDCGKKSVCFLKEYGKHIDAAIIDIFLNDALYDSKLVRVTGFHILRALLKYGRGDTRFLLYTGSSMIKGVDYSASYEDCFGGKNSIESMTIKKSEITPTMLGQKIREMING